MVFFIPAILLCTGCKKAISEEDKLPAATNNGANSFGCLVNGKAFMPNGYDGSKPNFHVIADPGTGDLLIEAYRYINGEEERIYFGANNINGTGHYPIVNPGNTSVGYQYGDCYIIFIDSVYRTGFINISKYDMANGILSGTFEAAIYKPSCGDTIRITKGRFDKKL